MKRTPLLSINKISKKYDNQRLYSLKDISFNVFRGQLIGVLGQSGSGKSTLLNLLARHEQETSGGIDFLGAKLPGPWDKLVKIKGDERVKLVKQDFDLFPNHTVEEILEYQIRSLLDEEITQRINQTLAYFELEKAKNKRPFELSGGMEQRLAIAASMISNPDVLLLDEPFSHLDISRKTKSVELLLKLAKERNIAIVLVTHEVQDVLRYCSRVFVLDEGRMVQSGTPQTLYHKPVSFNVAKLLSEGTYFQNKEAQQLLGHFGFDYKGRKGLYLRPAALRIESIDDGAYDIQNVLDEGYRKVVEVELLSKKVKLFTSLEVSVKQSVNLVLNDSLLVFV